MKYLITPLFIVCLLSKAAAQEPSELTDPQIAAIKFEIEKEAVVLRKKFSTEEYDSEFIKQTTIDFKIDTFKVEKLLAAKMQVNSTTMGMVDALNETETEYDKLLNKYYGILIKKLTPQDKELLKQAQRNWIIFRDSERKLVGIMSQDQYSGGGTMQNIIYAEEVMQITKRRLIELYNHIGRIVSSQ